MSKKIKVKEGPTKTGMEPVKYDTMLMNYNLNLAENLTGRLADQRNYDEERKLVESNARVVKYNFKLADRLVGCSRFFENTTDIVLLMTVFGASILGCFGQDMTFEGIMTVGAYGYIVEVLMSK